MWPASQSWVIDLRKTSLKSPLLFSGWQNCYVFTYQPNLPSHRIRTDHLCWWIPACLRLGRKWLEPCKWSSLGFPVTLGHRSLQHGLSSCFKALGTRVTVCSGSSRWLSSSGVCLSIEVALWLAWSWLKAFPSLTQHVGVLDLQTSWSLLWQG